MSLSVSIRDSINDEYENIELSQLVSESLLANLYDGFERLRLTGVVAEPVDERQLITLSSCKDYTDDFLYDEQQYRLYFAIRTWEQFNLTDAAFMLGYLHIVPIRIRYSALPFMAELMLRADRWASAFTSFIYKLRDDFKAPNYTSVESFYDEPTKKTVLAFLETIKAKAHENAEYEMVTVIERAMRDLKMVI